MAAETHLPLLRRVHLFASLTDAQLQELVTDLQVEQRTAGETIFKESDAGTDFYIIAAGQVQALRREGRRERTLATYGSGDHFGALGLLEGKPRSTTLRAVAETLLLRLDREAFRQLLKRYPQIHPSLQADLASRKLLRRLKFSWLMPNEVVYLIARRHALLLLQALLLPLGAEVLWLILALMLWLLELSQPALWLALLGSVPIAIWAVWKGIDWGNDFYIVTNQRVVYLEKVIWLYDSRQESPLASIQSVNIQSSNVLARALDLGDVVIRTFSGPITMSAVPHPQALATAVEEYWRRAKLGERKTERETIHQAVRQRLQTDPEKEALPRLPTTLPRAPAKRRPLGEQLARFFSFKVRVEEGDLITYRKHIFLLFRDIVLPSLLIVVLVTVPLGLSLAGFLPFAPLRVIVVVQLALFIPLALWWLYEFADWRNDIYQIATDQIIDIYRKPLGKEDRKTAPLGNILSLRYERIGLLGLFLNYGTVIANIGNTEFRFEGVFDPMGVQTDIYRRMEALSTQKTQSEVQKRQEEISRWLDAYHTVSVELQHPELRVGYFPIFPHAQVMLGLARGEFQRSVGRQAAIHPILFPAGPAALEALLQGSLDLAYVGPYPFLKAWFKNQGQGLYLLAGAASGGTALVVRSGPGIQGAASLSGKRVAVPQLGNTQDMALGTYLRAHRLQASSRRQSVQVTPMENARVFELFQQGHLDGAWLPGPWASWLLVEGGGQFLVDERLLWHDNGFVTTYVVASQRCVEARPDLIQDWLTAHAATTRWAVDHPAEARSLLAAQIERLTGKKLSADVIAHAWDSQSLITDAYSPSFIELAKAVYAEERRDGAPQPDDVYDRALLKKT